MSKIVVVGANHAGTAMYQHYVGQLWKRKRNRCILTKLKYLIPWMWNGLWIEQIDGAEGLFYSDGKLEAMGVRSLHELTCTFNRLR